MAIYHLTAKVVSRGKGDSSVAAAAYQSRSRMVDERTGEVHNYSRNAGDVLFEGIYAPKDAPAWSRDRASLWNHVEAFERRKDAQLARSFDIALPHELTVEQNRYAVQDWVRDNFTRKGWIADVAVHAPGAEGDDRNIHAHVLVVMRKLDGAELAAKKERAATVADRKSELEALRESWERIGNRHLERHGFEPTLDRRSFEDRGIEQLPTVHLGKDVSALERDGVTTDRGDLNREIVAENERRVIDLAAARTMRDAQTAAQGRTDDTRPEPQQPMQEAAQRPEQPAAEIETRGAAAEPSIAAHQSASTVSREAEIGSDSRTRTGDYAQRRRHRTSDPRCRHEACCEFHHGACRHFLGTAAADQAAGSRPGAGRGQHRNPLRSGLRSRAAGAGRALARNARPDQAAGCRAGFEFLATLRTTADARGQSA